MMDVSDGLLKDALRMASDSGLALRLEPDAVPRFDGATLEEALTDGEDYELIFAVAPGEEVADNGGRFVVCLLERTVGSQGRWVMLLFCWTTDWLCF